MNFMDLASFFWCGHGKRFAVGEKTVDSCSRMPRKNPLPKREAEICSRLREYREGSAFSQEVFARSVGVDLSLLSSYENRRAPVRYDVARSVALVFGMSEPWLADGTGASFIMFDPAPDRPDSIPPGMAFSEAYDRFLKPLISKQADFLQSVQDLLGGKRGRKSASVYEKLRLSFVHQVSDEIQKALPKALPDYYRGWKVLCESVEKKHRKRVGNGDGVAL
jgi:transcriptional regulator with XRE-family HTH domain